MSDEETFPNEILVTNKELLGTSQQYELQVSQAKSLEVLAEGIKSLADFVTKGGLSEIVAGYAKSQSAASILGGLATHDGRKSLDARLLGQNAIEIAEQVLKVTSKFHERLSAKEERDPEIKEAKE